MSLIGVSTLELRQLIERAFEPDCCEVSCADGVWLTIRLGQGDDLIVTEVRLDSLTTCHDVFTLVGQVREEQRLGRSQTDTRGSAIA
ncbi:MULTISPECIES: DUF1652 domain-containing protein [Pseudomonas]|uniref:DUF1652 domain-containing protein n=1 Tax=Pseudomonas sp. Hg7Tf TaxID=3236988 RepID=A0AB39I6T6_9PSED|nr:MULTISPECIES: DUF1652 domain-containing protein [Pseudomonas]MDD1978837.1 DUF1652 domain-containing protein [Pseudomonas putida]MDH2558660.1 DUF1652 domain-containing protein [Pseudomonas sp. Hg5Tf]QYX48532.1 DUF1652 domain-containing protein [Pseudomonas sp. S11A 273]